LVENCTQAVARDCLAHSLALVANGLHEQIVMHVHDEIVVETGPETSADDICRVMGKTIPWAKTLPLNAAGFETQFYKKD
jgi:DNA polymerase